MARGFTRHPIKNFFIKKPLQVRMIAKILIAVLVASAVCWVSLVLVYFAKFDRVLIYTLDKATSDLSREHIVQLMLPTLLISSGVNILVGIGVGLYASRKYAIPVYKIERWAQLLQSGKMTALIRFREKEELQEVSDECNKLTQAVRSRLLTIKKQLQNLHDREPDADTTRTIAEAISFFELEAKPMEVYTSTIKIARDTDEESVGDDDTTVEGKKE